MRDHPFMILLAVAIFTGLGGFAIGYEVMMAFLPKPDPINIVHETRWIVDPAVCNLARMGVDPESRKQGYISVREE